MSSLPLSALCSAALCSAAHKLLSCLSHIGLHCLIFMLNDCIFAVELWLLVSGRSSCWFIFKFRLCCFAVWSLVQVIGRIVGIRLLFFVLLFRRWSRRVLVCGREARADHLVLAVQLGTSDIQSHLKSSMLVSERPLAGFSPLEKVGGEAPTCSSGLCGERGPLRPTTSVIFSLARPGS